MRKFFLHLLILVMLTPGLACGGILCAAKAQAATPVQKMHCHESADPAPDQNKGTMLFKDCSKAELYQSDSGAILKKPELSGKAFDPAFTFIPSTPAYAPSYVHAIRGPPPDWPTLSETHPSILLTTLRLRV